MKENASRHLVESLRFRLGSRGLCIAERRTSLRNRRVTETLEVARSVLCRMNLRMNKAVAQKSFLMMRSLSRKKRSSVLLEVVAWLQNDSSLPIRVAVVAEVEAVALVPVTSSKRAKTRSLIKNPARSQTPHASGMSTVTYATTVATFSAVRAALRSPTSNA